MSAHHFHDERRPDPEEEEEEEEVHEVVVFKPAMHCPLGVRFRDPLSDYGYQLLTPDGAVRCVVECVTPEGIAETVLAAGDEVVTINGEEVGGPSDAAAMLREIDGYIRLGVIYDAVSVASPTSTPQKATSPGGYSTASEVCCLSDDDEASAHTPASRGSMAEDSSSGDDERVATGAEGKRQQIYVDSHNQHQQRAASAIAAQKRYTGKPSGRVAGDAAPQRPVAGAPFKLELPPTPFHEHSPAVTGTKGHLRLSAKGSGKQLLRKKAGPGHADGSLTARVRALGSLLSPRA